MQIRPQSTRRIQDVSRIAVLRANRIGDLVLCLPALSALREAYPDAEITLLGTKWHAAFLSGRPGPIDRVIALPPIPGVTADEHARKPLGLSEFVGQMQAERFDLALQMHGGGRYSNPFITQLGARVAVGLRTPDAALLDRWLPYVYLQPEIARFLEVVDLVGADTVTWTPQITVTEQDLIESKAAVPADGTDLVALHPGALDVRRRWPANRFSTVGDALAARGARVIITGSADDRGLVDEVARKMSHDATVLAGGLSLGGLLGLYRRCRLVVGNDTGPLHLAMVAGARVVGIYWCPNFVTAGPSTRARTRPVIAWTLRCPDCGEPYAEGSYDTEPWRPSCDHEVSWVDSVSVDIVLAAAHELWEATWLDGDS